MYGTGSDNGGGLLYQFDCNALEVVLSPLNRELEASNSAAEASFSSLHDQVMPHSRSLMLYSACHVREYSEYATLPYAEAR